MTAPNQFQRTTLTTSRLMDFCSRKELITQTGHQPDTWPLVVLKELVDNALDACEEIGAAPEIYLADYQPCWDVVFDGRGHFQEPHTETTIGLGTLSVRNYLGSVGKPEVTEPGIKSLEIKTNGPLQRFGAVLFVEKEGFTPLFDRVQLARRFDIAIMSTKGVSNTASRQLVDDLCGHHDITLLVLHDFDKAGFSILGTLRRNTRRYWFRNQFDVIDLGLRLTDVQELDLEPEASFDKGKVCSRLENLKKNGATPDEVEFLLNQRVELNALPSDQLIEWIEAKLEVIGIAKVVPDKDTLTDAYRRGLQHQTLKKNAEALIEEARRDADEFQVPDDLVERVRDLLAESPQFPWDVAVAEIINNDNDLGDAE